MNTKLQRVAIALALAFSLPFVAGCSSKESTDAKTEETLEQEEAFVIEDDETSTETTETTTESASETQRVGADGIGYVTIPSSWVVFNDVDGNNSIQWCDGTPYTVISLNTFNMSTVPEEDRESFTAEDAAKHVWINIINDGVAEEDVKGASVQLAGRDAFQVYGYYPDGSYLVCWLAEDSDGVIRYVAAEGPESTIMDAVTIVQDTYEY